MQIQVNVNNLTLIQNDELNENEYNIHSIQFTFSNEYEGNLAKVALFTANDKSYKMILQDDKCSIPPEVLANQGCFTLGVYAFEVDGENLIERFSPSPIQLYIQTGSYISDDNIENSEPLTATDKEQILAQIEVDTQQIEVNTQDISNIKAEQTTQNTNIQNNANEIERVKRLIPTKTSELQNDSGFIDNSVNNLINYTLTTQTGSKIDLEINSSTYELTAKLYDKNNNLISTSTGIDLPIESMIVNVSYNDTTKKLTFTLQNGTTIDVDISDIIDGLVSQTDFDALELRVDTAETDIETLQGQVETLETQVSELEEQVSELEANQLTSGPELSTSYYLQDSSDSRFRKFIPIGRTTQDGDPTPENPVPIKNTGDSGNVNEKVQNKNLIGLQDIAQTTSLGLTYSVKDGKITINGTASSGGIKIPLKSPINCKNGTNYVLSKVTSGTSSNNNFNIQLRSNGASIKNPTAQSLPVTYNDLSGTIDGIRLYIGSGYVFTNYILELQLEQGSTATPYQAHAEQNISFPLLQGQKLMEGDYLADDGVHHVMKEIRLGSSNDFYKDSSGNGFNRFIAQCSDMKSGADNPLVCSHFKQVPSSQTEIYTRSKECIASGSGANFRIMLVLNETDFPDVNTLNAWLTSNDVKLQYPLAEEVIDPYTEAQQTAWEEIKKARTYKNVTHISSEDETPANVDIVYVRDLETVINNLS